MNERIKKLSILPGLGSAIVLLYLYVLCIKGEIQKKLFCKVFLICALFASMGKICADILVYLLRYVTANNLIFIIVYILMGYILNVFVFTFLDKKWEYLTTHNENGKVYFLEKNKKQLLHISLILSVIMTIVALVMLVLFEII